MRAFVRPVLALTLALAPALTAHADPFDGSERGGAPCVGAIRTLTTGSQDHYGVVSGGPYVVADVLRNDNGFIEADDVAGATNITMTCLIENEYGLDIASATTSPSSTVVVLPPRLVAFTSYYSNFQVCTSFNWTDNNGNAQSANDGCIKL